MDVECNNITIIASHQEDLLRAKIAHQHVIHTVRAGGADEPADLLCILRDRQVEDEVWGARQDLLQAQGDRNVDLVVVRRKVELSSVRISRTVLCPWKEHSRCLSGRGQPG